MGSARRKLPSAVCAAVAHLTAALLCARSPRAAGVSPRAGEGGARPNVLLIVLDDANMELGVYGHPVVRTPGLDRLAARGVRFSAAYCQYPLCNPSRIAILTGLRPTTSGYYTNEKPFTVPTLKGVPILPLHLKQHGYATGGSGKISHNNYIEPSAWDEYYLLGHDWGPARPANPAPQDPYRYVYGGPYMNGPDGALGQLMDTKHVSRVIDMAGRFPEPFFLAVGLQQTHVPWLYPEALLTYYDPAVDVPPLPWEEQANTWQKNVYWRASESYMYLNPAWQKEPDKGRAIATVHYWRSMSYDDTQIGRILDALDASGLRDRTIIVVVGENGWSGGYHKRWNKAALFDWCTRVPLIISVPWLASGHGRTCARPVELVDIYPTLAELCGLSLPQAVEGLSLHSLLENPDGPGLKPAFSMYQPYDVDWLALLVRTERYKFVYWPKGMHQLYDMQADPGEYANLFPDPNYRTVWEDHRQLLTTYGFLPQHP